jgi:hypothetical protein
LSWSIPWEIMIPMLITLGTVMQGLLILEIALITR